VAVTDLFAGRATLRRSVRLLTEFRFEQSDPARFYGALAADTVSLVTSLWTELHGAAPTGRTLLDVGGGPGYFATAFEKAGLNYVGVEPDPSEMHAGPAGEPDGGTFVRASGMALPFADDSVDICLSSNVAEHVARPWSMGREMLRVTRPGGLVVLSYTVWLGPFGGHEMGLTHYLGGQRAAAHVGSELLEVADPLDHVDEDHRRDGPEGPGAPQVRREGRRTPCDPLEVQEDVVELGVRDLVRRDEGDVGGDPRRGLVPHADAVLLELGAPGLRHRDGDTDRGHGPTA